MEFREEGVHRSRKGAGVRISVTTIESFRLFMEGDWMEEGELIATIKGEFIQKPAMRLGQAFGRCLERPGRYRTDEGTYKVPIMTPDGWMPYIFTDEVMDPCLAIFDRRGVFEAKATKDYFGHTLVAKADQILGTRIIENKTKLTSFDFDRYAASYQWRFMVDMFEASAVTYNVFCLSEDSRGDIGLNSIETFHLYPYASLHEDCRDMARRFVEYVQVRKLEGYLESAAGNKASGDTTLVKDSSPQAADVTG